MARGGDEALDTQQPGGGDRFKLIGGGVALGVLALFLLQNLQEVSIHFLWFEWSTRMIWALLASAVIGALAMVLFTTIRARRRIARRRAGL